LQIRRLLFTNKRPPFKYPKQVCYYFPIATYLQSLFNQPTLVPYLHNDAGEFPPGHTRLSRGYRHKVLDNPVMNQESRNQSVVGCTDGVPLFDDKVRGAWPIIFKDANLPDSLGNVMRNCHIVAIQGNEYLTVVDKKLKRVVRSPKTMKPIMDIIGRECTNLYYKGTRIIDASKPVDDPQRVFTCRLCLLFWCGDYPGQALVSSFTHKGIKFCHWCHAGAWKCPATNRMICDDYRRDLGRCPFVRHVIIRKSVLIVQ
jgi:hypothetical protein